MKSSICLKPMAWCPMRRCKTCCSELGSISAMSRQSASAKVSPRTHCCIAASHISALPHCLALCLTTRRCDPNIIINPLVQRCLAYILLSRCLALCLTASRVSAPPRALFHCILLSYCLALCLTASRSVSLPDAVLPIYRHKSAGAKVRLT